MSTQPVTVRLSEDVLERLERSRTLSEDSSPGATVRRLIVQALDQERIDQAPLDDRIAALIQSRVAVPDALIAQYSTITKDAIASAHAVQQHSKALADLSFWLKHDMRSVMSRFGLALGTGLVLGAVAGVCAALLFAYTYF